MNLKKKLFLIALVLIVFVAAGAYLDRHSKFSPKNINPVPAPKTGDQTPMAKIDFQNYGPAPQFQGIDHWLNSAPLSTQSLKGKVVLVDFWTFSCINCIRTLPYVTKWYDTYKDQGFVVVGVHTPEFAFEKDTKNVADAIKHFNIHYPVAQDNEYATWNAYNNQYWPAEYLIDQKGNIVYIHFGEGDYDKTENAIRTLLGLETEQMGNASDNLDKIQSPEMYFGTDRLANLSPDQTPSFVKQNYALSKDLALNNFALEGSWVFTKEAATLAGQTGKIRLKFHSGKVFLVGESAAPAKLSITVDGVLQPPVTVEASELYTLFNSADYSDHLLEITIVGSGFQAFTFTFG
jgi:thiol-disulfide isomerase/thioredoxin